MSRRKVRQSRGITYSPKEYWLGSLAILLLGLLIWSNYVVRKDNLSFDGTNYAVRNLEGKISDTLLISDQEQIAERARLNIIYNEEKNIHDVPAEELESIGNKGLDTVTSVESCSALGDVDISQDLERGLELYNYRLHNRGVSVYEKRRLQDQALSSLYADSNTSRTNFYLTMEHKEQFNLYLDGLKQFVSRNDNLAHSRQLAVRTSLEEFRGSVDSYIADRDGAVLDSINTLGLSIQSALNSAKDACSKTTDAVDTSKLRSDISIARAKYLYSIRDLDAYQEQVDNYAATLLESVEFINTGSQKQSQELQSDFSYIKPGS